MSKSNYALLLNGSNQYGDVAYNATLAPTDVISLEAKIVLPDWTTSTAMHFLSKTQGGGWCIDLNEGSAATLPNVTFVVHANGIYNKASFNITPLGWVANSGHDILGTFDGRLVKLYLDGVLQVTTDLGANFAIDYSVTNSLAIGCDPDGNSPIVTPDGSFLNGVIDKAQVWHAALTQTDATNHANKYYPDLTNLVGQWDFNEGTGTTAHDSSGNGFDASLKNTPSWLPGQFSAGFENSLRSVSVGNGMSKNEGAT